MTFSQNHRILLIATVDCFKKKEEGNDAQIIAKLLAD